MCSSIFLSRAFGPYASQLGLSQGRLSLRSCKSSTFIAHGKVYSQQTSHLSSFTQICRWSHGYATPLPTFLAKSVIGTEINC